MRHLHWDIDRLHDLHGYINELHYLHQDIKGLHHLRRDIDGVHHLQLHHAGSQKQLSFLCTYVAVNIAKSPKVNKYL